MIFICHAAVLDVRLEEYCKSILGGMRSFLVHDTSLSSYVRHDDSDKLFVWFTTHEYAIIGLESYDNIKCRKINKVVVMFRDSFGEGLLFFLVESIGMMKDLPQRHGERVYSFEMRKKNVTVEFDDSIPDSGCLF